MPRTTRDELLRLHGQGDNDLDRHLSNLREMAEIYEPVHPEIAQQCRKMARIIINYQKNIYTRFRFDVM